MSRRRTVSDAVVVAADPAELYALVADPTQMARWSPENTGASTGRSGALDVGDTFVGTNTRGRVSWVTRCVVTAAEPGERFAWRAERWGPTPGLTLPVAIASWEYRFVGVDGGTEVTETWHDDRGWPDVVCRVVDPVLTGGRMFHDHQERNIRRTLERLRDDVAAS